MLTEIEKRIFVSDEILEHEYDYTYGDKKNAIVEFHYYKPKTDKEYHAVESNYAAALSLARYRARDGRYKNYEFLIY